MLKRILLNLLYTLLCSAAISSVIILAVYYCTPSLHEDFDIPALFFWLGILYDKLIAFSLIALLVAIPAVWHNRLLSVFVYFIGCVLFIVTTIAGIRTTPIGSIILVWIPFVVFVLMHIFFYIRLIKGRQPANIIA